MIGQIRGTLIAKTPPEVLVDVAGVTYEIQVPMSTLYQLPDVGSGVLLHTHFVVREDAQLLYGFADNKEKTMFRALIKVNGVGPKMALAILSGMEADEFVRTVRNNDVATMVNMPGIGKKTAERLIVEMRDRLTEWGAGEESAQSVSGAGMSSGVIKEAESALLSLGYKSNVAGRVINQIAKDNPDINDSEALIRLALKSML
ncbi:MAG: Holliday junction branch migration protein RuvA [Gammaproteobacteria bacterium]